jgi:hypothetical protein
MTDDHLDRLGDAIAADGPAAHHPELLALAQLAGAAGASSTVVDLLADATAPAVVRSRAFARAVAALRRCRADQGWTLAA